MLKRDDMNPGAVIRLRPILKPAVMLSKDTDPQLAAEMRAPIPALTLMTGAGTALFGGNGDVPPGTELEIIEGPKRRYGIATAIVRERGTGAVGHIYWCDLRINADLVAPASPADGEAAGAAKPRRAPSRRR